MAALRSRWYFPPGISLPSASFAGYAPADNPKVTFVVISPDVGGPNSDYDTMSKVNMRITVIFMILLVFISFPKEISNRMYLTLYIIELTAFVFLFLNMEEKGYRKTLMVILVLISLISGIPVNLLI